MKILSFYRLARQSFALGLFLLEAFKNSSSFSTADKLRGRTRLARSAQPKKRAINLSSSRHITGPDSLLIIWDEQARLRPKSGT